MNYRRGLFRLWIVLSVVWVALLTLYSWDNLTAPRPITAEMLNSVDLTDVPTDILEAIAAGLERDDQWPLIIKEIQRTRPDMKMEPRMGFFKNELERFVIGVVLVPLAALLIGSALSWAFSGFSRNRP